MKYLFIFTNGSNRLPFLPSKRGCFWWSPRAWRGGSLGLQRKTADILRGISPDGRYGTPPRLLHRHPDFSPSCGGRRILCAPPAGLGRAQTFTLFVLRPPVNKTAGCPARLDISHGPFLRPHRTLLCGHCPVSAVRSDREFRAHSPRGMGPLALPQPG